MARSRCSGEVSSRVSLVSRFWSATFYCVTEAATTSGLALGGSDEELLRAGEQLSYKPRVLEGGHTVSELSFQRFVWAEASSTCLTNTSDANRDMQLRLVRPDNQTNALSVRVFADKGCPAVDGDLVVVECALVEVRRSVCGSARMASCI